jgi:hypothetical protein
MTNREADDGFSQDVLVSPETCKGLPFRIPFLRRERAQFTFPGLYLPIGWQDHIDQLKKENTPDRCKKALEGICRGYHPFSNSVNVRVDEATGIITDVALETKNAGTARLEFSGGINGNYWARDVYSIDAAEALLSFMCHQLLSAYPVEFQEFSLWGATELVLPKSYIKRENGLSESDQEDFLEESHNIAGQFGEHILDIRFNTQGMLLHVSVGSAVSLHLEENKTMYRYRDHNVDFSSQAEALHAIGATFINTIFERNNPNQIAPFLLPSM